MQTLAVFTFVACCVLAALAKPPVTVSPAEEFSPKVTAAPPVTNHTTMGPHNTTVNSTTVPPHTKATTPPPHNTTNSTTPVPHNATTTMPPHNATTTMAPHNTTTTMAPHNTTTTMAPHNVTTVAPPGPTPSTTVTTGKYFVNNTGGVCVMAQMALQIRLNGKDGGTFIVQPKMTKSSGSCEGTKASLKLSFREGAIAFSFHKNVTDSSVYVDSLAFNLTYTFTKGSNRLYTANNQSLHLFPAKVGHSYSCKKESLYMGKGLYLDISQDRMQAFNVTKSAEFGPSDSCPADQENYRVAIAVGITLLVLIIVVVVVYLIGRRKRTSGYQSL